MSNEKHYTMASKHSVQSTEGRFDRVVKRIQREKDLGTINRILQNDKT